MIDKIGQMRQWLNEERITDPKKMVTNEEILFWLKEPIDEYIKEIVGEEKEDFNYPFEEFENGLDLAHKIGWFDRSKQMLNEHDKQFNI